jgi:hypothetical protein
MVNIFLVTVGIAVDVRLAASPDSSSVADEGLLVSELREDETLLAGPATRFITKLATRSLFEVVSEGTVMAFSMHILL